MGWVYCAPSFCTGVVSTGRPRFILWPTTWSILVDVPCALENYIYVLQLLVYCSVSVNGVKWVDCVVENYILSGIFCLVI